MNSRRGGVFRRLQKTGRDGADVTWRGSGRSRYEKRRSEQLDRRRLTATVDRRSLLARIHVDTSSMYSGHGLGELQRRVSTTETVNNQ